MRRMVSTRGIKLKFFVGERVLCYEPDPTKAKVLYDSKVLDIVIQKDQRGRRLVEYLIHFQGWNSSWDRCVGEEYVLKDTTENRQLQRDLAEKSQLQLGAYLYRKERKKHNRKSTEQVVISSEDGSSGSPARIDTDENPEMTSSSDENSSFEDDIIEIDLTPELREILENDYYLINKKNKLLKLPAEPNIVNILETFYKHYATNQICGLNEKNNSRYRQPTNNNVKTKPEDIEKNLSLCREILDGLRIYFDFTLNDLLLYAPEKNQVTVGMAVMQPPGPSEVKIEIKNEENHVLDQHLSINSTGEHLTQNGHSSGTITTRRRTLRSNKCDSTLHINGIALPDDNGMIHPKPGSSVGSSNSDINGPMSKALAWRLLPEHVYSQQPLPPCLAYGSIHFLRLFVKLPELLTASSIPEVKLKLLLRLVDSVIDFLNEHREWFGEKYYIDK